MTCQFCPPSFSCEVRLKNKPPNCPPVPVPPAKKPSRRHTAPGEPAPTADCPWRATGDISEMDGRTMLWSRSDLCQKVKKELEEELRWCQGTGPGPGPPFWLPSYPQFSPMSGLNRQQFPQWHHELQTPRKRLREQIWKHLGKRAAGAALKPGYRGPSGSVTILSPPTVPGGRRRHSRSSIQDRGGAGNASTPVYHGKGEGPRRPPRCDGTLELLPSDALEQKEELGQREMMAGTSVSGSLLAQL
ncbi:transcription factor EC-like [Arapaima gigas]